MFHTSITGQPDLLARAHEIVLNGHDDQRIVDAAQEAIDTNGDEMRDLAYLLAEEEAAEQFSARAYAYEWRTGRDYPFDFEFIATASESTVPFAGGLL